MEEQERVTENKRVIKLSDGNEYTVKPLSLADTKRLLPAVKKLDELRAKGDITEELIEQMADVCFQILQRANPTLTKEKVCDLVELESVYLIILYGIGIQK